MGMKEGKTKKRDGGKKEVDKKNGEERGGKKDIGAIGGWCKGKRMRKDNDKRRKRGWRTEERRRF